MSRRKAEQLLRRFGTSHQDRPVPEGRVLEQARRAAALATNLRKAHACQILGDPVGTGKTEVALAALGILLVDGSPVQIAVIVAPNDRVRKLWVVRATEMFGGTWRVRDSLEGRNVAPAAVILTRKQLLAQLARTSISGDGWLVVVDEAHREAESKNEEGFYAQLTRAFHGQRALLITATPYQISGTGFRCLLGVTGLPADYLRPIAEFGQATAALHNHWAHLTPDQQAELLSRPELSPKLVKHLQSVQELWPGFRARVERHRLSFAWDKYGVAWLSQQGAPAALLLGTRNEAQLGDWATAYHVARLAPVLLSERCRVTSKPLKFGGDMFERRLVSSSEAFLEGKTGAVLKTAGGPLGELYAALASALGDGDAHPKVEATVRAVSRQVATSHVLVFCVFHETRDTLKQAFLEAAEAGTCPAARIEAPTTAAAVERLGHDLARPARGRGIVAVLTDMFSESIDLDGPQPAALVHHDIPWNPARMVQRWGRVVRISTGFQKPKIITSVLAGTADERLYHSLKHRISQADLAGGGGTILLSDSGQNGEVVEELIRLLEQVRAT